MNDLSPQRYRSRSLEQLDPVWPAIAEGQISQTRTLVAETWEAPFKRMAYIVYGDSAC